MQYIQLGGDGQPEVHDLDVDSYISEIGAHYLCELYDPNVCAYTFDACVAASFVAHKIIVNTPELYDLSDDYKTAMQQAAMLLTMAERNGEVDELPSVILSRYIAKLRESMLTGCLEVTLFSPRKMRIVHDSKISLDMVVLDAVRLALMILPAPKLHVHTEHAWTIAKYNVHMAAPSLRTDVAINLHETLLPIWQTGLSTGGLEYVNPITAKIIEQQKLIDAARAKINEISDECAHPENERNEVRKGDTGNWSQSDDSYSIEITCKLCGRHWYYNKNHGDKDYALLSTRQVLLPITK